MTLIFFYLSALSFWLLIGFGVLFWLDGRFLRELDRFCGDSPLAGLFCVIIWPVPFITVLISAWLNRRNRRRFHRRHGSRSHG